MIAIILYGPPGSGKGTQANLLARKLGLTHVDTGRVLEEVLHDPRRQREKIVRRERRLFDSGKLLTPSWVLAIIRRTVAQLHRTGSGIVFSGSPRTLPEARGLLPFLGKLYGKKNIFIFKLIIPPRISIERNSRRRICSICATPLLTAYYPSRRRLYCPICGGPFYRRTIDNARIIKVRLVEYRDRTEPIFDFAKRSGHIVREVEGIPAPYLIFKKIYDQLKNAR